MKRILTVFAIFIHSLHPVFAEDRLPWETISENWAYRLVVGATTYIAPASQYVSSRLVIPGSARSMDMTIRQGTATISYATTVLSGDINDASFDIGIFDSRTVMAQHYQNNMHSLGAPPPYMIPVGDSSITFQKINGVDNFKTFGSRTIPLTNYGVAKYLILYASMIENATTANNQGITWEVFFNR